MSCQHLVEMFYQQVLRLGSRTALKYRKNGMFVDCSWNHYANNVSALAAGLRQQSVKPGDRVAILSENRMEWLISDLAVLSMGGVDVPIHTTSSSEQIAFQLAHSESRVLLVSNQLQVDKVLPILDQVPDLEFVIPFDNIVFPCRDRQMVSWSKLIQQGRGVADCDMQMWRDSCAPLRADDLATIIYTSGTTGEPKGVMLTHGNLFSNAQSMARVAPYCDQDVVLNWLPYSHVYARTVDHYLHVVVGSTLCVCAELDEIGEDLEVLKPTVLTAVPRYFEKVWSAFQPLDQTERNEALREYFGPRMRWLTSGGAPLSGQIAEAFMDAGIPIMEGYGLTETSPVIAFNRLEKFKIGTVGLTLPEVQVRIAGDGEIMTRGPHVMKGYWRNEQATSEAIDVDGWLRTGDVGELDEEGFLTITDRKKDLIVTSTGKNIAPQYVERLLMNSPVIDQACVFGEGRPFLVALIVPDWESLPGNYEMSDFIEQDISRKSWLEIMSLYEREVKHAMDVVSHSEKVRKWRLIARPFSLEKGEVTSTMKLRRRKIEDNWKREIEQLYRS